MNINIFQNDSNKIDKNFLQYLKQISALNYLLKMNLITIDEHEKSSVQILKIYSRKSK